MAQIAGGALVRSEKKAAMSLNHYKISCKNYQFPSNFYDYHWKIISPFSIT